MNVVEAVASGNARFEWSHVVSVQGDATLIVPVTRDSIKIDGVRWPASAYELQQIADLLNGHLLTPTIIDLMWLQATTRIEPIINHTWPAKDGKPEHTQIVADMNVQDVSQLIDERIAEAGDSGGLIECVGKYWVLINQLLQHQSTTACNYGWCATRASGPGLTPGVQCWQRPGFRHNDEHKDPSQGIRLMYSTAWLKLKRNPWTQVKLMDVFKHPQLSKLVSHEGVLKYTRQPRPKPLEPVSGYRPPPIPARVSRDLILGTV